MRAQSSPPPLPRAGAHELALGALNANGRPGGAGPSLVLGTPAGIGHSAVVPGYAVPVPPPMPRVEARSASVSEEARAVRDLIRERTDHKLWVGPTVAAFVPAAGTATMIYKGVRAKMASASARSESNFSWQGAAGVVVAASILGASLGTAIQQGVRKSAASAEEIAPRLEQLRGWKQALEATPARTHAQDADLHAIKKALREVDSAKRDLGVNTAAALAGAAFPVVAPGLLFLCAMAAESGCQVPVPVGGGSLERRRRRPADEHV